MLDDIREWRDRKWLLVGKASALEDEAERLEHEAGLHFTRHKDEVARYARERARILTKQAKKYRQQQEQAEERLEQLAERTADTEEEDDGASD